MESGHGGGGAWVLRNEHQIDAHVQEKAASVDGDDRDVALGNELAGRMIEVDFANARDTALAYEEDGKLGG